MKYVDWTPTIIEIKEAPPLTWERLRRWCLREAGIEDEEMNEAEARLRYALTHHNSADMAVVKIDDLRAVLDELARVRESLRESKLIAARWQTAYDKEVSGSIDDRNAFDKLRTELEAARSLLSLGRLIEEWNEEGDAIRRFVAGLEVHDARFGGCHD